MHFGKKATGSGNQPDNPLGLPPEQVGTLLKFIDELHSQTGGDQKKIEDVVARMLSDQAAAQQAGGSWSREHNARIRTVLREVDNPYNPYHQALNALGEAALRGELDIAEGDRESFISFLREMKDAYNFKPDGPEHDWRSQPAVGEGYPVTFIPTDSEKRGLVQSFQDLYDGELRGKAQEERKATAERLGGEISSMGNRREKELKREGVERPESIAAVTTFIPTARAHRPPSSVGNVKVPGASEDYMLHSFANHFIVESNRTKTMREFHKHIR